MANTNPTRLAGWASRWLTGELQALASVGNWEAAIQTFQQMGDVTREEPIPGTQNMMISTSNKNQPTKFQPSHEQQLNSSAKVFHYTTIISACAKAEQWEAALRAFTHMHREAKCEPNVKTYTSVIHACTKGNRLDLALRAWGMMEADGVVSNCYATTALVAAFARAGKWQEAIAATLEAESNPFPNQEPNIFTYTAAMDACRRAGNKADKAVEIMKRMKDVRGIRGNTVSYTTALNACAAAKDWESALKVLDQMREEKIFLVPFARTCALEALSDAPDETLAEKALEPWGGKSSEDVVGRTVSEFKRKSQLEKSQRKRVQDEQDDQNQNSNGSEKSEDLLQDPPTPASYQQQKKG